VAFGTDVRSFLLRAERNTSSNPRVYTVTYRATDAAGHANAGLGAGASQRCLMVECGEAPACLLITRRR